jgi:hypothetical protein
MHLARLELEDRDRHVADIVFPDEDEVAATEVMPVPQKVRRPVLGLGEELVTVAFEYVVRERRAALQDAVAQPCSALREQLPDVDLVLRLKSGPSHPFPGQ